MKRLLLLLYIILSLYFLIQRNFYVDMYNTNAFNQFKAFVLASFITVKGHISWLLVCCEILCLSSQKIFKGPQISIAKYIGTCQ